jgi:hypothetical protein
VGHARARERDRGHRLGHQTQVLRIVPMPSIQVSRT